MRKFIIFWGLFYLSILVSAAGITYHFLRQAPDSGPPVVMEVLDPTASPIFVLEWQQEIHRRFSHAVGVVVHGGGPVENLWLARTYPWAKTEIQVVQEIQTKYPDRTVVLVSCNPQHLNLGISGVYYAKDYVWQIPDRNYVPGQDMEYDTFCCARIPERTFGPVVKSELPAFSVPRSILFPNYVGSIYEFAKD